MKEEKKRPRVLMLSQYIGVGGLERMILSLVLALKKRGYYEPYVYTYDFDMAANTGYQNLIQDYHENAVPLLVLKKPGGFSFSVVRNILRLVRCNQIDIIHSHNLGSLIYAAIAKVFSCGRVRLLHTQHSFIHLKENKRYAFYERFFSRLADKLTVVSEDTRETYKALGLNPGKIALIENGVEVLEEPLETLEERRVARRALLTALPTPGTVQRLDELAEHFWIIYLARLHPRKGHNFAMQVWGELNPQVRKKSALIFVGPQSGDGQLDKLRALISEAPERENVIYAGGTKRPDLWLKASDVFLFCSEFEGLPLGPLEAVGAGLPAVLSDISGHNIFKGVCPLFPLSNPALGARHVEALCSEVEANYRAARQKYWNISRAMAERYSIAAMTEKYEKLYGEL